MCKCVPMQEQAFGELEKNSDKQQPSESQRQTDPPSHFHNLLSALHKHLLAHCYVYTSIEVENLFTSLCNITSLHQHRGSPICSLCNITSVSAENR